MIRRNTSLGFVVKKDETKQEQETYDEMREKLMAQMKKAFLSLTRGCCGA